MKQVHKWFCAFVAMVVLGSVLVQVQAQREHKQGALSGVVGRMMVHEVAMRKNRKSI